MYLTYAMDKTLKRTIVLSCHNLYFIASIYFIPQYSILLYVICDTILGPNYKERVRNKTLNDHSCVD